MSARVVPGPDGHTCTLRSAGLWLACSYESPEVRAKERNTNQEHSRFCPQVSGLKKKERKRKAPNTSPGEPCKFRNSSFANSKGTGGKLTQLVWPLCLLPTPFLGPRSRAAGASCHRERQGLQRQRGKGSIQGRLVLPVWDSPQKRDNKCGFKGEQKMLQWSTSSEEPLIGSSSCCFMSILYLPQFRLI